MTRLRASVQTPRQRRGAVRSVGKPVVLGPVDAAHPQVASWQWRVPTLTPGDPGHYCIVAFVHHSAHPVNGTGFDVDAIVPGNRQIGQKNLQLGPPLGASHHKHKVMRGYIEFHNPTAAHRPATLRIAAKSLPPQLRLMFALSKVETAEPLHESITAVVAANPTPPSHPGFEETELIKWINILKLNPGSHATTPEPPVYTALPSSDVTIKGVQLEAFTAAGMAFVVENIGTLPPGSRYIFHVQQLVAGKVVGGSAYVVRIEGNSQAIVTSSSDEEEQGWVPSYATEQISKREKAFGKQ